MTGWQLLTTAWDWEPSVLLGCVGLGLVYAWLLRFRWSRRAFYAAAGLLALLFALVSPLDALGDRYLFSAHMAQHLLLILFVPPLLLLGIPPSFLERALSLDWIRAAARVLQHPVVAWFLGVGTLWIWHLPVLYQATLTDEYLHIFEHLTFLASASIFWSPVLLDPSAHRLSPLGAFIYLMSAGFAHTMLAVLIAYAPGILYPAYAHPADSYGILTLIREDWGMTVEKDQEIAGLMMWVPGSFPYLLTVFVILYRWFNSAEATESRLGPHSAPAEAPQELHS